MYLSLKDRALLVNYYDECNRNERRVLKQYRTSRGIRQRPVNSLGWEKIMKKFETTGVLSNPFGGQYME